MKTKNISVLSLALAAAISVPAFAGDQKTTKTETKVTEQSHTTTGATHPDSWVLTKVKAQFATSDIVDATDINIDVVNGRVSLAGQVSGQTEKNEAIRLAETTEGVVSVNTDRLVVSAGSDDKPRPKK